MKRRIWWIGAAAACLSASMLFARQGVVKTRDGKTFEGDIEEKPDQVIVNLHGIRTVVNRDNVEGSVEYFDNVEARYQAKLAQLPKKPSAADHIALARWLFDAKSYDLALKEIEDAKKLDPNSAEAATLEQTVISQRRIEKNRPGNTGGNTSGNTGTASTPPRTATGGGAALTERGHYLTPDDINTIRQMEWREKDATVPRAVVPADVRKRFVDLKAIDPGQFAALKMPQQAYYILSDPDVPGEMKKEIKLTTDPQALADYRRSIQPLVVNNCATIGCHGGRNGGDFILYSNNTERDEVAYTNFYILQNYKKTIGDKEYSMIDRTYPDRSILAQFALSPDTSELKHPEIKGQAYKPIAPNRASPQYRTIVDWMKNLQAGEPNYGIKYDPPGQKKKTGAAAPGKAAPDKAAPDKAAPGKATPGNTGAGAPAKGAAK